MKWKIAIATFLIVMSCIILLFLNNGFKTYTEPDICLGQKEVPEGYFEERFYVEFNTKVGEQEIRELISESGLSTTSSYIGGDIYYMLFNDYSVNYSERLENLFSPIPEIKSIVKRHNRFIGVEFYKNVSPSESKKIVEEIIKTNNIPVTNDDYSDIGLARRSSAYIDIPKDSEFNAVGWVCKFRENKIVKDASLQSSIGSIDV